MEQTRRICQRSIFDCEVNGRVSLEHYSYKCNNYLISVLIDENLSWKNHVDCVITKMSRNIQMIAKLICVITSSVVINICKSLFLPNISILDSLLGAIHLKHILSKQICCSPKVHIAFNLLC